MKTKKLKLLTPFLLLLPLFVVLLGAGCEKKDEVGAFSEEEFLKFTDFGCENSIWNFKTAITIITTLFILNRS